MADLLETLPDFNVKPYSHLIHSLEKNHITVSDLITLESVEIAKSCPLPLGDVRDLVRDLVQALRKDVGISTMKQSTSSELLGSGVSQKSHNSRHLMSCALREPDMVKTLDPVIDKALGGGFHTGCITEIAGESAAGKTQLVLGLLLSVQLPPPQGLARNAIYISTETPLSTNRLQQINATNQTFSNRSAQDVPSFDRIYSIPVNDLEAQEHIIDYQLPLAVKKYNAGLIVMDSVAANYRAEYETRTPEGLSERAKDVSKLGKMLRKIAQENNLAVVVTNQVSDRFDEPAVRMSQELMRSSSPAFSSSPAPALPSTTQPGTPNAITVTPRGDEVMNLDHQQRFFTGWGAENGSRFEDLKTPALGLAWTNQIAARIVLKVESERVGQRADEYLGGNIWRDRRRRRFMSVVFAPWVEPSEFPVEYEIRGEGITAVRGKPDEAHAHRQDREAGMGASHPELLDEKLWGFDGADDEEEFP